MKRFLKNNQNQLSMREQEDIWRAIQEKSGRGEKPQKRRRLLPAFGMTSLTAVVLLAAIWLNQPDAPEKIMGQAGLDKTGRRTTRVDQMPVVKAMPEKPEGTLSDSAVEVDLNADQPDQKPVTVEGRVFDRETGEPLSHANIIDEKSGQSVLTDSQGHFEIPQVEPGKEVDLKVKSLGYEDKLASVTPKSGDESKLEIGLDSDNVQTLQAFDVEGAEYMGRSESAVTQSTLPSESIDKLATEVVEEALQKQAGVIPREGELHVRGGRSGEVIMQTDGQGPSQDQAMGRGGNIEYEPEPKKRVAPVPESAQTVMLSDTPMATPGSVTGGTTPPNGQKFELMYHEHAGVNPFIATDEDALSTFAVDVDNASFTLMRGYLEAGAMPPADAIRVEEFVNYFSGGYPRQTDDVFAIHTDGSGSRFGQGYQLLRVGLQGMDIDASGRKPANLIFVIDISGSMARENRLGLVKQSLHILLDELNEGDQVGIVVYGNSGKVILEPTDISQRTRIASAIDRLGSGGSTNACEGLEVAYDLARKNYDAGLVNRIVLCSDGVANMGGTTRAEEMLAKVRRSSDNGVTLSTIGFGMGNYNDVLMEKLANQGDGNYFYVDKLAESERVFRQNLTGLLQTIARQVKVQVEFNPDQVQRWRLLGYENRDVADRDFRNDSVDAGEVGAGHQVTALYELKLKSGRRPSQLDDEDGFGSEQLGTVRVRYEYPAHDTARAGQVQEIEKTIKRSDLDSSFNRSDRNLRLQAVAAEFAEILRRSFWAKESRLADLNLVAKSLAAEFSRSDANGAKAQELAHLIGLAADLEADRED